MTCPLVTNRRDPCCPLICGDSSAPWWRGEKPPGGRLSVNLTSHHGVGRCYGEKQGVGRFPRSLDGGPIVLPPSIGQIRIGVNC